MRICTYNFLELKFITGQSESPCPQHHSLLIHTVTSLNSGPQPHLDGTRCWQEDGTGVRSGEGQEPADMQNGAAISPLTDTRSMFLYDTQCNCQGSLLAMMVSPASSTTFSLAFSFYFYIFLFTYLMLFTLLFFVSKRSQPRRVTKHETTKKLQSNNVLAV